MQKKQTRALCYLRTHRRKWGLSQKDLARLIGNIGCSQLSRYENSKRGPKIEVALACQVIFGVIPSIMFLDTYASVEEEVMRNMYRMNEALKNTTSLTGLRKRELFAIALSRAIEHNRKHMEI
jgi:transcriptional regulator with XRE-family HTH domain